MDLVRVRRLATSDVGLTALIGTLFLARITTKLREPTVWVEDARYIMEFSRDGVSSLFVPINGFLHVFSKLITFSVSPLTLVYYPIVTILIATGLGVLICLQIRRLFGGSWGVFAAMLTVLIPTYPEVYGLPSYVFWWSGLYLAAVAIAPAARIEERHPALLYSLVVLGGLSGPFAVLAFPILALRLVIRRRPEMWSTRVRNVSSIVAVTSVIQLVTLANQTTPTNPSPSVTAVAGWSLRNLGTYWTGVSRPEWAMPIAIVVVVALVALAVARRQVPIVAIGFALLYAWSSVLSILRVDPDIIDPGTFSGPRYFFVPLAVYAWAVAGLVSMLPRNARVATSGVTLVALWLNAGTVLDPRIDQQHWMNYITACSSFDYLTIPIAWDGNYKMPGLVLGVSSEECDAPLLDGLFPGDVRQIAHTMGQFRPDDDGPLLCAGNIVENLGFEEVPSDDDANFIRLESPRDRHDSASSLRLRVTRGDAIAHQMGRGIGQSVELLGVPPGRFVVRPLAALESSRLTFSNKLLPETFEIVIRDEFSSRAAWSAVTLRRNC
jgi:hypothetical protein